MCAVRPVSRPFASLADAFANRTLLRPSPAPVDAVAAADAEVLAGADRGLPRAASGQGPRLPLRYPTASHVRSAPRNQAGHGSRCSDDDGAGRARTAQVPPREALPNATALAGSRRCSPSRPVARGTSSGR